LLATAYKDRKTVVLKKRRNGKSDHVVTAIIGMPSGSRNKYAWDKKQRGFRLKKASAFKSTIVGFELTSVFQSFRGGNPARTGMHIVFMNATHS
jgi:hypothetical protein